MENRLGRLIFLMRDGRRRRPNAVLHDGGFANQGYDPVAYSSASSARQGISAFNTNDGARWLFRQREIVRRSIDPTATRHCLAGYCWPMRQQGTHRRLARSVKIVDGSYT